MTSTEDHLIPESVTNIRHSLAIAAIIINEFTLSDTYLLSPYPLPTANLESLSVSSGYGPRDLSQDIAEEIEDVKRNLTAEP